jgi:hypothetical protein
MGWGKLWRLAIGALIAPAVACGSDIASGADDGPFLTDAGEDAHSDATSGRSEASPSIITDASAAVTDAADATLPDRWEYGPPTFSPPAGTYTSARCVSLSSSTPGATIYYTTDGTSPTTKSHVYDGPISVTKEGDTNIRAMAVAPGFANSTVAAATFTVHDSAGVTHPVDFSVRGGTLRPFARAGSLRVHFRVDDLLHQLHHGWCTAELRPGQVCRG